MPITFLPSRGILHFCLPPNSPLIMGYLSIPSIQDTNLSIQAPSWLNFLWPSQQKLVQKYNMSHTFLQFLLQKNNKRLNPPQPHTSTDVVKRQQKIYDFRQPHTPALLSSPAPKCPPLPKDVDTTNPSTKGLDIVQRSSSSHR